LMKRGSIFEAVIRTVASCCIALGESEKSKTEAMSISKR
jgi:hypothetical protein